MASFPTTPKAYPVSPKAYPVAPTVFPGGSVARYPAASATLSVASASMGPYPATTQFYRVTGADIANLGTNGGAGSTIDILWEQRGMADETIFAYCDATSGYFINHNGTADTRLFLRSGAPTNHQIRASTLRKVLNRIVITRLGGGALRCSTNGEAAVQLSAAPSYVDASVTAECILGRSMSGVGTSGMTTGRHVQVLYYRGSLSDAELQAISGNVNDWVNRFKAGSTALAKLAALGGWHLDVSRDVDVTAASITAGAGTTPPTWTKNGANIAKNTIPQFREYSFAASEIHDGGQLTVVAAQSSGPNYNRGQPFQRKVCVTDATDAFFSVVHDWTGVTQMCDFAVDSGGTAQSNSTTAGGGIEATENFILRLEDVYGLSASSKTLQTIDGPHSIVGGIVVGTTRGHCVGNIYLPATASFAKTLPSAPVNCFLLLGDSTGVGQGPPSTSTCYQAAAMLIRADYPGSVKVDAMGSGAWYHWCKDAAAVTASVARAAALLNGTGSNRIWAALGINDWRSWDVLWGTAANTGDYTTRIAAWLDAIHAAVPGAIVHLQSMIDQLNEATLVPAVTGVDAPTVRTATLAAASGRAWVITHDGTAALTAPPSADYADDRHPTVAGHANWKAWIKAELAASADTIGSGY